jgi:hypothetical protein
MPSRRGKALLMSDKKMEGRTLQQRYRCEFDHLFGSESCEREASVELDGLVLCEEHALQAKLEGQIECCRAMLAHIELWSREATRRERPQIAELLEVERLRWRQPQSGPLETWS